MFDDDPKGCALILRTAAQLLAWKATQCSRHNQDSAACIWLNDAGNCLLLADEYDAL